MLESQLFRNSRVKLKIFLKVQLVIFSAGLIILTFYFRNRKRYSARRMSAISDKSSKSEVGKNKPHYKTKFQEGEERKSLKRDSRHTLSDDDTVTEWIPEIPFWNVRSTFHLLKLIF